MADKITLQLDLRTTLGKKVKKLRREGTVPVHLYGPGIDPRYLQCHGMDLIKALAKAGGNTPLFITIAGEADEHLAFVREVQWDPVHGNLFHVDFLRTEATQLVSAEVPVVLEGDSPGARESGGHVFQQLRSLTVEALPLDMPQALRFDLSSLVETSSVLRAGDCTLPPGTTLLTDPEEVVARVELPRAVEAEAPAEAAAKPEAPEDGQEQDQG